MPTSVGNGVRSVLKRRALNICGTRKTSASETASLMRFVEMAKTDGHSTEKGLQLAIQAILVSPKFLFRIEHDANPTDPSQIHPVSEIELASRLSYFLWSSMPDEEPTTLAAAGKLNDAGTLRA